MIVITCNHEKEKGKIALLSYAAAVPKVVDRFALALFETWQREIKMAKNQKNSSKRKAK